jgi:hypothetical protein
METRVPHPKAVLSPKLSTRLLISNVVPGEIANRSQSLQQS